MIQRDIHEVLKELAPLADRVELLRQELEEIRGSCEHNWQFKDCGLYMESWCTKCGVFK